MKIAWKASVLFALIPLSAVMPARAFNADVCLSMHSPQMCAVMERMERRAEEERMRAPASDWWRGDQSRARREYSEHLLLQRQLAPPAERNCAAFADWPGPWRECTGNAW